MIEKQVIHLVDDDATVRASISFMLRASGFEVHSYASGAIFLRAVALAEPGCILLDLRMSEMGGLEVQAELNARGVAMPVILLTGHADIGSAVAAMRAGAQDFMEKPFEERALVGAIEGAFRRPRQGVWKNAGEQQARARVAALSRREQEVLKGLFVGKPNKAIAGDLAISARTVEVYRYKLMSKLEVHCLSSALQLAFEARLFDDA